MSCQNVGWWWCMCKDEEVFLGKFCLLWSNSLTENYLSQWVNFWGFLCWPKDPLTPRLPFLPASDFTIHQRKRTSKRFIINLILWSLSSRSISFLGMGCQNVGWWWCICKDEEVFLGKCCLLWSNNSVYTFGKKWYLIFRLRPPSILPNINSTSWRPSFD